MSRWGVGPVFAVLSVACFIPFAAINRFFYPLFAFSFMPRKLVVAAGMILIITGVIFLLFSLVSLHTAYNGGKLVTSGVFGICRNPIYASWAVFIVPGIIFILDSWLLLIVPVIMCLMVERLARKEETYLEEKFKTAYINYKENTPVVLPFGWLKRKKCNNEEKEF